MNQQDQKDYILVKRVYFYFSFLRWQIFLNLFYQSLQAFGMCVELQY